MPSTAQRTRAASKPRTKPSTKPKTCDRHDFTDISKDPSQRTNGGHYSLHCTICDALIHIRIDSRGYVLSSTTWYEAFVRGTERDYHLPD